MPRFPLFVIGGLIIGIPVYLGYGATSAPKASAKIYVPLATSSSSQANRRSHILSWMVKRSPYRSSIGRRHSGLHLA